MFVVERRQKSRNKNLMDSSELGGSLISQQIVTNKDKSMPFSFFLFFLLSRTTIRRVMIHQLHNGPLLKSGVPPKNDNHSSYRKNVLGIYCSAILYYAKAHSIFVWVHILFNASPPPPHRVLFIKAM